MTALRILLARLLGLFAGGARRERELRAEIDGHIAEAADEYVRQGMRPEQRHAALRQFGGVTQTIEAHRAQRRFTFFSTLRQDVQYAVRTLIRAPGFAIVAVLTLAIGILGNTTIFSGVNALLARTREIGIRMALGAPATDVRALVVRQGLALTGIGLAIGFLGGYLLAPAIDRPLIRMPATDPVTFAGTALLLTTTTLMACYLPARRATRIDPIVTLRTE